jgi:hypothetical protein
LIFSAENVELISTKAVMVNGKVLVLKLSAVVSVDMKRMDRR